MADEVSVDAELAEIAGWVAEVEDPALVRQAIVNRLEHVVWRLREQTRDDGAGDQLLVVALRTDGHDLPRRIGQVLAVAQPAVVRGQPLAWETIPVVYADLDEQTARLWMLRDNTNAGEWDWAAVSGLLDGLDAAAAGFAAADLDAIARSLEAGRQRPDPDTAPDPPAEPRSQRGDVYELGPHRLMCGDATVEADVSALVGTHAARVMVTDPPYGVSVDHTWRDDTLNRSAAARTGLVANDDRYDWEAAYQLSTAPVAYVWHSALYAGDVKAGLERAGYLVRQQLIWVKTVHAIGRAAYQWRHETCWYAVRKGGKTGWRGGRKQSTVIEAASPIMAYGGGQDDQRSPHPTQKPIAVIEPPVVNHTVAGDYVYDPFAGSGTTMIAADKTGRRALMMELDPVYCDVIRDRWEAWNAA